MLHPLHSKLVAAIAIAGLLFTLWFVRFGGMLVEPVDMRALGSCGEDCSTVRCTFENQGPLRASAKLVIDAWAGGGYEDGTERQEVHLDLGPGERHAVRLDFPGVPYSRGTTQVRCMPWYAAGRWKER